MKKIIMLFVGLSLTFSAFSQQKKPLDHSVYDHWKDLKNAAISDNGNFISYEVNPQQGDGWLYLYNVKNDRLDSLPRGYKASFVSNGNILVYRIKPQFEKIRHLERKKTKRNKFPTDSLSLCSTEFGVQVKFGQIQKVEIPEETSNWIAILMKKPGKSKKKEKDNPEKDQKKKNKKLKKAQGAKLILYNAKSGDSVSFRHVTQFALAKNGKACVFVSIPRDTINRAVVMTFLPVHNKQIPSSLLMVQ